MSDQFDLTLSKALEQLKFAVQAINEPVNLDGMFISHLDVKLRLRDDISWKIYENPLVWLQRSNPNLDQAPSLAALGYLLNYQLHDVRINDSEASNKFKWGLERVKQRKDVFSLPNSWAMQPTTVLGICLGILSIQSVSDIAWMLSLTTDYLKLPNIAPMVKLVYFYVQTLLNNSFGQKPKIDPDSSISLYSLAELAFAIWLVKRELVDVKEEKESWLKTAQGKLIEKILREPYEGDDYKAGIIFLVAIDYIEARSQRPDFDLVCSLLENFLPAMERWKEKWEVKDEYDVQSLLWLILRPSFANLTYEEYLPKFGRSSERYDIGIPELGLIIEAKYTRRSTDLQKIVEEIGKDVAQLQPQTIFQHIIAFIYDESCSTERHAWVKQTLESIPEVKSAIIVAAPAICRASKIKTQRKVKINKRK